jgi:DinB superfamily
MKKDENKILRQHLVDLLKGGNAHADFDKATSDMSAKLRGKKVDGLPHSPWMLLEHLRIAQWDILEFSRNAKHVSPDFPAGYWPKQAEPPNAGAWEKTVKAFDKDLKAMQDLVVDLEADLFAKIPWGDGQTILRQALLLADHNAYHIAQLIDVRRILGAWAEG